MATILSKKRKKQKQTTLSNLKTLGNDLLSSRSHINNLPILLSFISPTSRPDFTLESLLSLQAFFTPVLPDLPSFTSKHSSLDESQNDPEFIYRTWLRSKFDEFVTSLIEVSLSLLSDEVLKEVALNTIMEFVKLGNEGRFQSAIYHRFIFSMVHSTDSVEVLVDLLASKYLKYIDVRYFTYISLEKIARILEGKDNSDNKNPSRDSNKNHSEENTEQLISKMHCILSHVPSLEGSVGKTDYEVWAGSVQNEEPSENNKASHDQNGTEKHNFKALSAASIAKKMKLKFTKAWLSFLRLPLPLYVYKAVLVSLHQEVIPHLSNPVVLCDFLTRSYDIGGVVSVMALSSLYILMMQHGLEYLNFYEKLYALLVPSIFMAKHRAKFFELLDSCLKSPLLPAYLAAAFAKKLSRLSIAAPPSGALVIIALIHNLLRRHPSINFLVHQENTVETAEHDSEVEKKTIDVNMELGIDCFNNEERDPKKTHAMRSSLWEIDTLRHHYCPAVSRLVLSLENDLTVRAKTTELSIKDFSSASYATIFGSEVNRRMKQVPLALHRAIPTSLFSESEFAGWTFKHDKKDRCARENGANESNSTTEIDGFNNSSLKRLRSEAE